jgi:tRNA A22 N-methylase
MSTTEKFLMLFSDFEMIVVEKTNEVKIDKSNTHHSIGNNQTKSELKKVLKRLTEEYNRAKKSFKQNKLSRQELFDFEWRLFEIQEEIKRLDDETTA